MCSAIQAVLVFICVGHICSQQRGPISKITTYQSNDQLIDDILAHEKDRENPFFVHNLQTVFNQYAQWKQHLPRIAPFFATKCNPSPVMIALLAALGAGFDCASQGEIDQVLGMGVSPERIVYANTIKHFSYIKHAEIVGVKWLTFDNTIELEKIARLYPSAHVILRIKVPGNYTKYPLSTKFGADPKHVLGLMEDCQRLGLALSGVSFHVGSDAFSGEPFRISIENARKIFDKGAAMGFKMYLLDIGGGFPGDSFQKKLFVDIAKIIKQTVDTLFPPESGVTIIAEPGRYFGAAAFSVAARIVGKRFEETSSGAPLANYYITDGTYGSFRMKTWKRYDVWTVLPRATQRKERPPVMSKFWGPTCDSVDYIGASIMLPEMSVGEWVTFDEQGAYSLTMMTTFNAFPTATIRGFVISAEVAEKLKLPSWARVCQLLGKWCPTDNSATDLG